MSLAAFAFPEKNPYFANVRNEATDRSFIFLIILLSKVNKYHSLFIRLTRLVSVHVNCLLKIYIYIFSTNIQHAQTHMRARVLNIPIIFKFLVFDADASNILSCNF